MASGLSDRAYEQAVQIIDHEAILGPLEKEEGRITWSRDPELYYFTVFGEPGGQDPWAWRARRPPRIAPLQRVGRRSDLDDAPSSWAPIRPR